MENLSKTIGTFSFAEAKSFCSKYLYFSYCHVVISNAVCWLLSFILIKKKKYKLLHSFILFYLSIVMSQSKALLSV